MSHRHILKTIGVVVLIVVVLTLVLWAYNAGYERDRDWNCRDFKSFEELARFLKEHPGDPYNLDGNNNGRPCESL